MYECPTKKLRPLAETFSISDAALQLRNDRKPSFSTFWSISRLNTAIRRAAELVGVKSLVRSVFKTATTTQGVMKKPLKKQRNG